MRIEPAAELAEVVELVEPVRRGGLGYPAGHQFAVVRRHRKSVVVRSEGGVELGLPPNLVRRVKAAPAGTAPPADLAGLEAAGLLKRASEVGAN